jgi:hypothetical protein
MIGENPKSGLIRLFIVYLDKKITVLFSTKQRAF